MSQAAIACILPVRGRHARTLEVADQLRARAGMPATWIAVGATPEATTLAALATRGWVVVVGEGERLTYWQALTAGTARTAAPWLAALASDLDPYPDWLAYGWQAARARFGDAPGLMGFAGDGHAVDHSCHMLIARALLAELGGWPVWYDHNFGDRELCRRAQALGRYGKSTHAVLRHAHPIRDRAVPDDPVYREGQRRWEADAALHYAREEAGWPPI